MKLKLMKLWHEARASYHWNRMVSIQENTGRPHGMLMHDHASYAAHSLNYNESKDYLQQVGAYIPAIALITNKRPS